jgi:hypothetical protein
MITRQQRLDAFDSDGDPPAGELMELLCEDHNGTARRVLSGSCDAIVSPARSA